MDLMENQMRLLKLKADINVINNKTATMGLPTSSKVAALVNNLETSIMPTSLATGCIKKVGPSVPPKPHKKKADFPEIPHSYMVKQVCEPLYSQRLQAQTGNDFDGKIDVPLQRKQPTYASGNSLYDKSLNSQVTLDNPAILDQQLEVLAHHKKQLEKKGLLQQEQQEFESIQNLQKQRYLYRNLSNIPKLSSTSLLKNFSAIDHGQSIYTNEFSNGKLLYSAYTSNESTEQLSINDTLSISGNSNIYCNFPYEKCATKDGKRNISIFNKTTQDSHGNVLNEYQHPKKIYSNNDNSKVSSDGVDVNDDLDNDQSIPPPLSPVSSSYSELRRATNVFNLPTMQVLNKQQQPSETGLSVSKIKAHEQSSMTGNTDDTNTNLTDNTNAVLNQQTYINMHMPYENEFNSNYSSSLQTISTYESIYEPINPPSQLSARSNYLLCGSYVNGDQLPESGFSDSVGLLSSDCILSNSTSADSLQLSRPNTPLHTDMNISPVKISQNQKEAEVEALTDFLVNSMDSNNDNDSYGVCNKCNERVMGETSGCTAMDQVYHIVCFSCSQCQINLQGKPFYALDGKPYCEYDYLQTLEKCSVCMKPILERILRATGKPYHPQCFTCVVCGQTLDGIPFTVDAINQNYCIADFHKKFAPRCCVCKEPIMPEPGEEETVRVVALDRSFHFECYKCEDCGLLLSSEAEGRGCYPLDDHVLCKSCNAKRVQMLTSRMTTDL